MKLNPIIKANLYLKLFSITKIPLLNVASSKLSKSNRTQGISDELSR